MVYSFIIWDNLLDMNLDSLGRKRCDVMPDKFNKSDYPNLDEETLKGIEAIMKYPGSPDDIGMLTLRVVAKNMLNMDDVIDKVSKSGCGKSFKVFKDLAESDERKGSYVIIGPPSDKSFFSEDKK